MRMIGFAHAVTMLGTEAHTTRSRKTPIVTFLAHSFLKSRQTDAKAKSGWRSEVMTWRSGIGGATVYTRTEPAMAGEYSQRTMNSVPDNIPRTPMSFTPKGIPLIAARWQRSAATHAEYPVRKNAAGMTVLTPYRACSAAEANTENSGGFLLSNQREPATERTRVQITERGETMNKAKTAPKTPNNRASGGRKLQDVSTASLDDATAFSVATIEQ